MSRDNTYTVKHYIDALCKEWNFFENSGILGDFSIDTIYIGGGTPSILDIDMWGRLDDGLFSRIDKSGIKEWSIECNPESFTTEKARMYADSGVTRLTFGVQSLNKRELSICGRAHNAEKALEVLNDDRLPRLFDSIGIDIIYALPEQTTDTLDNTLSSVLSIPAIKHISAYELTISEGTPFARYRQKLKLPTDEICVEMYHLIGSRCKEYGMRQYEISNYAFPGFESVHNKIYWSHKRYIGLGASAHSYIHPKRWSNVADIDRYISLISASAFDMSMPSIMSSSGAIDFEETINTLELSREIIFLGLRNADGINETDFAARTGIHLSSNGRDKRLREYVDGGLLEKTGAKWIPTSKGMLFADMMSRELMA